MIHITPATTTPLTGTWAAPGTFAATLAGVPAEVGLLRMSHLVYAGGAPLSANLETLPAATGGMVSATYPHPVGVGDASLVLLYASDASGGFRRIANYTAPTTALQVPEHGHPGLEPGQALELGAEGVADTTEPLEAEGVDPGADGLSGR